MYICVYSYFLLLSFAQEVERLKYLFLRGSLVDTYIANVAQEGEVDVVGRVLLIVLHEGEQCIVVVARDGQLRIMGVDVLHRLAYHVGGEAHLGSTEVQLAHQAIGHCIAMQHRLPFLHGPRLEGMTNGMAQVKGLSYAFFKRGYLLLYSFS